MKDEKEEVLHVAVTSKNVAQYMNMMGLTN